MAQVSDSIAATVTLRAGDAIKDLGTLSRKAKDADKAFGETSKSTARASSSFGSLRSGAVGLSASLGGIGAGAIGLAGVAAGFRSVIDAQSKLSEATNASKITFRDAAGQVEKFAASASAIGLSKRAALEAAAGFGTLLRGVGFSTKAAADFSVELTGLSADLASTFGGSVEQASDALRALFRGEGDPIEKYGVKVNEAAVTQRALQLGVASSSATLTEQDKTLARLTLAFSQTTAAQGDFARTQADTANQQRVAAAASENLRASLGAAVTPGFTQSLQGINALLGGLEKAAQNSGSSLGDLVKTQLKYTTVLGFVGSTVKDSAANFKDSGSALKTFSLELAAGREDSEAYRGAVAFLKNANAEAETTQRKLNNAIGDNATKMAQARQETANAATTIQGFVTAQRSAEDALIRVGEARTAVTDAERSLSDLRAKGKVDAVAVADGEQRVRDASQSTADARQRLQDSERELGDLRRAGPVDAKRVTDAERSVADATRTVVDARRALAEAEEDIAKLRAGPSADESKDATRDIARAQLDLERAQQRAAEAQQALNEARGGETLGASLDLRDADLALAEATDNLAAAQAAQVELQNRGVAGSATLLAAEEKAEEARLRLSDATTRQSDAEAAARLARAGDPEYAEKIAALTRDVDAAKRGVEGATRAEDKAAADLRIARAGDPDFETKMAKATDAVRDARRGLERAEQDLPFATDAAKRAQEDLNTKLNDGTPAANALRDQLWRLDQQYRTLAGTLRDPVLSGVGGGGSPGIINAGSLGSAAAMVRGRTAAPVAGPGVIMGRTAGTGSETGGAVVHTSIVLDGAVVARSVSQHQRGSSRQGGDVLARR